MFGERLWLITMRSDLIKKGPSRAPHRSLLRALGIDELEMKRPFVAVVNSKSDYIPGHMHPFRYPLSPLVAKVDA